MDANTLEKKDLMIQIISLVTNSNSKVKADLNLSFKNVKVSDLPSLDNFDFGTVSVLTKNLNLTVNYEKFYFFIQLFSKFKFLNKNFNFVLQNVKYNAKVLSFLIWFGQFVHNVFIIDTSILKNWGMHIFLPQLAGLEILDKDKNMKKLKLRVSKNFDLDFSKEKLEISLSSETKEKRNFFELSLFLRGYSYCSIIYEKSFKVLKTVELVFIKSDEIINILKAGEVLKTIDLSIISLFSSEKCLVSLSQKRVRNIFKSYFFSFINSPKP